MLDDRGSRSSEGVKLEMYVIQSGFLPSKWKNIIITMLNNVQGDYHMKPYRGLLYLCAL